MKCIGWLIAAAMIFSTDFAIADGPDLSVAVKLRINGQDVNGALETTNQINVAPSQEDAILAANIYALTRNSNAQLEVRVTTPSGTTDYTGSNLLRYDSAGCLTVSASGFMTVTPSGTCSSNDKAILMIFFTDANGMASLITTICFLFNRNNGKDT